MRVGRFSFGEVATNVAALMGDGSPSIFADALAVWYADQVQTTPVPVVPNANSVVPVSQNMLRAPMRLFSNQAVWGHSSATVADGVADGPQGQPGGASSFTSTAASFELYTVTGPVLAAGQYTVSIWAKRNTGTDQPFRFKFFQAAIFSPVKVATAAWQLFQFTATLPSGAQLPEIVSSDGATGTDLQVSLFLLHPGNAVLSEPEFSGHMYLGDSNAARIPPYSSGSLDFSGGNIGLVQLLAAESITSTTAIVFAKKKTTGSQFNTFLSKAQHYQDYTALVNDSTYLDFFYSGSSLSAQRGHGTPPDWHMITNIYGDGRAQGWIDNIKVLDVAQVSSPVSIGDFFINLMNGSFTGDYAFATMALFDRALTSAEVNKAYAEFSANLSHNSNTPALVDKFVVAEGDSITSGVFNDPYPNLYGAANSDITTIVDYATGGATIATLNSRAAFINGLVVPAVGRKNILTVMIGHNDIGAGNVGPFLAAYAAYCDAARAAGYYVVVCTILASSGAQFAIDKGVCNDTFRDTWIGVHCDAVINFDTTPMGVDANADNPTYFLDGTHPTEFGQTLLKGLYTTDVNGY